MAGLPDLAVAELPVLTDAPLMDHPRLRSPYSMAASFYDEFRFEAYTE